MNKSLDFIVIDNNSLNCFVAERMLRNIDKTIRVNTFIHAHEAFEYIRTYTAAEDIAKTIILLDIHMPVMDGFEFIAAFEQLPEANREQFIVYMLTASTDINDKSRSTNFTSIKRFLGKPLTFNILKSIIEEVEAQNF